MYRCTCAVQNCCSKVSCSLTIKPIVVHTLNLQHWPHVYFVVTTRLSRVETFYPYPPHTHLSTFPAFCPLLHTPCTPSTCRQIRLLIPQQQPGLLYPSPNVFFLLLKFALLLLLIKNSAHFS